MEGLIILMIFQLLVFSFVSSDQYYESCNPTGCGGIKMASPFYAGQQPSCCGFPGFRVFCIQNIPHLNLSGDTYMIKEISYTNQTLWIVNSVFSLSTFECTNITSVHNLTLNNLSLEFTSKPARNIILLQDCSTKALKAMSNSTNILCQNNSSRYSSISVVGVHEREPDWKEVAGECGLAVSVPYQDSSAMKMEDQIRAGFALNWVSSDKCKLCQRTGGHCLYNRTTATLDFQCSCSNSIGANDVCIPRKGAIAVAVLVAVLIIVICCTKLCIRTIKSAIKRAKIRRQNAHGNRALEDFIRNQESLAPKRYTYKEIKKMTKSFKEKLGEGGYSVVYKGKLLDGHFVAVKLLKQSKGDGRDFINVRIKLSFKKYVIVLIICRK